jgi:CheY-like chemotaxis protein
MYKNIKALCKYKRVLVVHKNQKELDNLEKLLNKLFLSIDTATDYDIAIEKFVNRKNKINLLITDLEMDSNDGIELLSKIREDAQNLPAIFLVENRNYKTYELAKIDNIDITKSPIDIRDLLNKISIIMSDGSIDEYTIDTLIHIYKSIIDGLKEIISTGKKRDYNYHIDSIINFFDYTNSIHKDVIDLDKFKIVANSAKDSESQKKVFVILKKTLEAIFKKYDIFI